MEIRNTPRTEALAISALISADCSVKSVGHAFTRVTAAYSNITKKDYKGSLSSSNARCYCTLHNLDLEYYVGTSNNLSRKGSNRTARESKS
jgi:hypothetical protein